MFKLKISKSDINKKLHAYLKEVAPHFTITHIKRSINRGQVKVNAKKVRNDYLLQLNDELTIYLNIKKPNDKFLMTKIKIPIFYEDENIIIFDKPKNISCQENMNEKINTLNNYLKKYCYQQKYWDGFNLENEPCLINRIDHNTTGLVLAAKNKNVARILNQSMQKEITKKYLTIIHDKPRKKQDFLIDYIHKDEKQTNKMIVSNQKTINSTQIKTKYQLLFFDSKYSVLEVELLTGKKHQIRAHLAFYKMYIVGDGKYGIKNKNNHINTQILISNQLIFNLTNEKLAYLNKLDFIKIKDSKSLLEDLN